MNRLELVSIGEDQPEPVRTSLNRSELVGTGMSWSVPVQAGWGGSGPV